MERAETGKVRNSSVELLRIIAMVLIIFSHYSVHGVGDREAIQIFNKFNYYFLENIVLGNLGTDIFVLIFGYFGIKTVFSNKKLIKLWFNVWTYSILVYIAALFFGMDFKLTDVIKTVCPVIFNQYWFFTAYIVLFVLTPYINKLLQSLTQTELKRMILLMLLMWCVISMVPFTNLYGTELVQFFMFYCVGAYLRLYPEWFHIHKKAVWLGLFVCLVGLFGGSVFLRTFVGMGISYLFTRTSVVLVGIAVCLLILFAERKPFYNRMVNAVAGSVFGVYLIHDNPYMRNIIWEKIFRVKEYVNDPLLAVRVILTAALIFIVCVLIDKVKKKLLDDPAGRWIDRHFQGREEKRI